MTDIPEDWIQYATRMMRQLATMRGAEQSSVARIEQGLYLGGRQDRVASGALQCPEFLIPGLSARPWHGHEDVSWTRGIEDAYPTIKRELLTVYTAGGFRGHPEGESLVGTGSWNEYRLISQGRKFLAHCAECPETTRVIEAIPGATSAGSVLFSEAVAGTHIKPHYGPHNARIRCQLGLIVPPGCSIRVADETRSWEEGKLLIFDDSFLHEVRNDGNRGRVVLIFDVWHPELTEMEILAFQQVEAARKAWKQKAARAGLDSLPTVS